MNPIHSLHIMNILCLSDQIDPVVYSEAITDRFRNIDLVLCAGGVPGEYRAFIVSNLTKPLFFVYGTGETREQEQPAEKPAQSLVYIGGRVLYWEGLLLAGVDGGERVRDVLKLVVSLVYHQVFRRRRLDVLLTYAPPRGIHDPSGHGSRSIRWFMRLFKPAYLIHGYTPIYDLQGSRERTVRSVSAGRTLVINAWGHEVFGVHTQKHHLE